MQSLRILIAVAPAVVLLAGCASMKNTPQQDYVWEAGRICDGQVAFWKMERVESDGRYWVRSASNIPPGRDDYFRCMQEQFSRNPYKQWLAQRPAAVNAAAPTVPSGEGRASVTSATPKPSSASKDELGKPTWAVGDEWSYRWESPRGKGTFVWVVDRFETVEGIESAVLRTGERELFYRRDDGALHLEKVGGIVEVRTSPPLVMISWPLEVGKTWTPAYTRDAVVTRQTNEMLLECRVADQESVTVAAGTFRTFHIVCLNQRSGSMSFEIWYAPEVGNMVKDRTSFSYGMRERELLGFKRVTR
jgi:hypothetical protein